ncbi:MAG: hypothetical protein CFE44_01090 [Burkholderiales bacterium PBB4]|nr:MAG: hypothetical protein CFE44_01090 [Burkholderiales bacterium PBB4]
MKMPKPHGAYLALLHSPAVDLGTSMATHFKLTPTAIASALALLLCTSVQAQQNTTALAGVTVTSKVAPVLDADSADVGGLGAPLWKTPQAVTVLGADILAATGATTLSQAIKLDASLADSYNTAGYIENMSIRGFLLDPKSNYLRNGLAISSYAPLALENKERVEVLKGVSGLQSGVSSPGGLVNFVTKVPLSGNFHTVNLDSDSQGGAKLHLDSNSQWGPLGVRFNGVAENLQSHFNQASGKRELLSLALSGRLSPDTLVTADLEYHHKRQPSVPGLGLLDTNADGLGDTLPSRINPRLNLNDQAWSLPFEATTTALQVTVKSRLDSQWTAQMSMGAQRTLIDDRIAFPDGCSNAPNYVYPGLCANGDVDVYDFRSEGEQRTSWSWEARASRELHALGIRHQITIGVGGHGSQDDLPALQAYNYVGSTNIFAPTVVPADPSLTELNTNSRQRATEGFATMTSVLSETVQAVVGFRTTSLARNSARSDGSRAVSLQQNVSTPWLAATWQAAPESFVYASWGQGVELESVPNRPSRYTNFGETLPALKSEQLELGWKWLIQPRYTLSTAIFSIDRPYADDLLGAGLPTRIAGAKAARHRGLELALSGKPSPALSVQSTLSWLDARFTSALDPALVGQRVTNVPKTKASVFTDYKFSHLPGLSLHGLLVVEDGKTATADGATVLPLAWQLDTGFAYAHRISGTTVRIGVKHPPSRGAVSICLRPPPERSAPACPWTCKPLALCWILPSPSGTPQSRGWKSWPSFWLWPILLAMWQKFTGAGR